MNDSPTPSRFKRCIRGIGLLLLNCWIVFHVAAIIISPLSVAPAAPLAQEAWSITGPYAQLVYMNHGYHFFAPNPSGAFLLGYEVTKPDGTQETGVYPTKEIFPRLFYHRHFMLTERLALLESFTPDLKAAVVKSYAEQVCRAHGGQQVTLNRIYHDLPSMERLLAGTELDDPGLYTSETLGTFSWEDF